MIEIQNDGKSLADFLIGKPVKIDGKDYVTESWVDSRRAPTLDYIVGMIIGTAKFSGIDAYLKFGEVGGKKRVILFKAAH